MPTDGWLSGGLTYAGYNIVGAVIILPLARHFHSRRDAVVAGVLAGPLAMLPGLLFFVCMIAWYPQIGARGAAVGLHPAPAGHAGVPPAVPGDDLQRAARKRRGRGACRQRARRRDLARAPRSVELPNVGRFAIAVALLVGSIFIADHFGLVTLIASGYRALAWLFLVGLRPAVADDRRVAAVAASRRARPGAQPQSCIARIER